MTAASNLANALGRRKMADTVGVLPTAVSNAIVRGRFPSSWFIAVKAIADEAGLTCPPELFGMKSHVTVHGAQPLCDQGEGASK
ncbi:hypothetical protein KvSKV_10425 [Ketogulonicigenium vulgare]|uniref:HTH cro/C1-type domain-containing protein n=1 Tax=Ketogulonicigenium vulgare (strain WSH-001) TaxID=759362 RepID=F9YA20_KETVW|nr:hypothetical protein KVU_1592 [Ketogulonicigenium vulgare WSH-001]ALJ81565.1 hypothetical protein KVH_10495 [Ketogulonicigenium vulgare]ANW35121.1 hypothetical protein KvSKV_10425 [Ketogulonicigenium vulgare]